MRFDGFLLGMVGAVLLALAAPAIGASGGPLHLDIVTPVGIGLVFFLHGATLPSGAFRAGAANWRLHALVHASTYGLFPLAGFALFWATRGLLPEPARIGLVFLCALPSTISSSVAMTALGRGNVAGAIFDATLSGLIGIVLTPALVALVASSATGRIPLLPAMENIARTLLLPLVAGAALRPWIGAALRRGKKWTSLADRTVILLIVYGAFCDSTAAGIWHLYPPAMIAALLLLACGLLAFALTATTFAARTIGLDREDEVAAVFCGSKKSLANGAPMAAILFGASPALGVIMLPIILYHQVQLFVGTWLARRYARRAESDGATAGRD